MDAAWQLAAEGLSAVDVKDCSVDESKVGEIINHLSERHPYFLVLEGRAHRRQASKDAFPDEASGRPMNGKRLTSDKATNGTVPRKKFPALCRR